MIRQLYAAYDAAEMAWFRRDRFETCEAGSQRANCAIGQESNAPEE